MKTKILFFMLLIGSVAMGQEVIKIQEPDVYTRTELQTSGEAVVNWDNITNQDTVSISDLMYTNQDEEFEFTSVTKNINAKTVATTKLLDNDNYTAIITGIRIIIQPDTMGLGTDPVISVGTNASTYDNLINSLTLTSISVNKIYDYDSINLAVIGDIYISIETGTTSAKCNLTVILNYKKIAYSAVTTDYYRLNTYGTEFYIYDAYDPDNFTIAAGDSVHTFKDGSGNNRTLTVQNVARALYQPANKRIYFNPSKKRQYGLAAAVDLDSVYTEVLVYNNNSAGNSVYVSGHKTANSGGYLGIVSDGFNFCVLSAKVATYSSQSGSQNKVVIISRSGRTIHYYVNGNEVSSATNNITTEDGNFIAIGGGIISSTYNANGYIYYYGCVKVALNPSQVTTLNAALTTRYGF